MTYIPGYSFTDEEINQIYAAGTTIGIVRDFWERFKEQDFVTTLGGALMEQQHIAEGATIPLVSELQDTVTETPESAPIDEVVAAVEEKLPEAETGAV